MNAWLLASAFIKTKSWKFLYNYNLTNHQIVCIMLSIRDNKNSQVETLDLVNLSLDHLHPRLFSNAVLNVQQVNLHYTNFDQLFCNCNILGNYL